jgi:hypothetical protein
MNREGRIILASSAIAFLVCGTASAAVAGPCTEQIAQLEQYIRQTASNPALGPSARQTVSAQLRHQPTRRSVEAANMDAKAMAEAELMTARHDDAAGDAKGCADALTRLYALYGIVAPGPRR